MTIRPGGGPTPPDGLLPDGVDIFLDGSAFAPTMPGLTRAGWAVVAMRPGTASPLYVCYGHLPGRYEQAAGGGELFAFIVALQLTAFPGHVYTDFQHLLDGIEHGETWCISPERRYATLWRIAWWLLRDCTCPELHKVKAHTRFDPKAEPSVLRKRAGNAWADAFAKAGAGRHPSNADLISRNRDAARIAGQVLRWAGRVLAHWPMIDAETRAADSAALGRQAQPAKKLKKRRKPRLDPERGGHVLVPGDAGACSCRLCGVVARSPDAARALAKQACNGGLLAQLPAETWPAFTTHQICFATVGTETGARPPLFWCSKCYAFASRPDCARDLQKECCYSRSPPAPRPKHKDAAVRRIHAGMYPSAQGLLKSVTIGQTARLPPAELSRMRHLALLPRAGVAPSRTPPARPLIMAPARELPHTPADPGGFRASTFAVADVTAVCRGAYGRVVCACSGRPAVDIPPGARILRPDDDPIDLDGAFVSGAGDPTPAAYDSDNCSLEGSSDASADDDAAILRFLGDAAEAAAAAQPVPRPGVPAQPASDGHRPLRPVWRRRGREPPWFTAWADGKEAEAMAIPGSAYEAPPADGFSALAAARAAFFQPLGVPAGP